jgi:hypothetical protein
MNWSRAARESQVFLATLIENIDIVHHIGDKSELMEHPHFDTTKSNSEFRRMFSTLVNQRRDPDTDGSIYS